MSPAHTLIRLLRFGTVTAVACIGGCTDSLLDRSLVFATHTTLGVEVSVSPSEASSPVKALIGYSRSEGVLNPVYHSKGVEAPATNETLTRSSSSLDADADNRAISHSSYEHRTTTVIGAGTPDKPLMVKRYRDNAYSVLAKISGRTKGAGGVTSQAQAEAAMVLSQWFATGKAAEELAKHPETTAALAGRKELSVSSTSARAQSPHATIYGHAAIVSIYTVLTEWALQGDSRAGQIVAELDALGDALPLSFVAYTATTSPGDIMQRIDGPNVLRPQGKPSFDAWRAFKGNLDTSIKVLSDALALPAFRIVTGPNDTTSSSIAQDDPARIVHSATLASMKSIAPAIAQEERFTKASSDAVLYFAERTTTTKSETAP